MKLKELVVSPCNIRQPRDEDNLEGLAESIKESHLISKLILREGKKGGYEVVAGQRRFRAMVEAYGDDYELPDSDYVMREGLSDDDAFLVSLEENQQRLNLSPMELCRAALKLNAMGVKDKEVAKKLNVSAARLKRIQVLMQETRLMPEPARKELAKPLDESHFTDDHWDKVRKVDDPDVVKDVVDYIIEHEAPARDVPGIVTGVQKKLGATGDSGPSATPSTPSADDGSQSADGPIVYDHKGDLELVESGGKMTFVVHGKGEDEEVPVDHYLEYLRRPDKFKCKVTLKLKFLPVG